MAKGRRNLSTLEFHRVVDLTNKEGNDISIIQRTNKQTQNKKQINTKQNKTHTYTHKQYITNKQTNKQSETIKQEHFPFFINQQHIDFKIYLLSYF